MTRAPAHEERDPFTAIGCFAFILGGLSGFAVGVHVDTAWIPESYFWWWLLAFLPPLLGALIGVWVGLEVWSAGRELWDRRKASLIRQHERHS